MMSRTNRTPYHWYQQQFKLNPEYADKRYQQQCVRKQRSYQAMSLCPVTGKILGYREYGSWFKSASHRSARHNAKIMTRKEALDFDKYE